MWPIRAPIHPVILNNKHLVGVSLQFNWRDIEVGRGRFDWSALDARIAEAGAAGLKVVFLNRLSLNGAPDWIKADPGVKTIRLVDTNVHHKKTYGKEVALPLFWDPTFHEARKSFLRNLGARYAGNQNLVGVMASFANYFTADWAVPHAVREVEGARINQVRQWITAGYTTERMFRVGREVIDATATAFPNQAIKLPIGVTHRRMDGSATALAERILAYGYKTYPTRFYAQFNSLNTGSPRADDPTLERLTSDDRLSLLRHLRQHAPQIGIQDAAAATHGADDGCRQNGGQSPCPARAVLQKTIDVALTYRPSFLEVWGDDATEPTLSDLFERATLAMKGKSRP